MHSKPILFHSLFKFWDEFKPLVTTFTVPKREATFESVTATRKSQVYLAAFLSVTVSSPLWHSLIRPTDYYSIVSLNVNIVAVTHWADLLKLAAPRLALTVHVNQPRGVFSKSSQLKMNFDRLQSHLQTGGWPRLLWPGFTGNKSHC